jgi:hypothetical protein
MKKVLGLIVEVLLVFGLIVSAHADLIVRGTDI